MSNEIDKKLFKQIFGHTLEALANKLIDTTNKEKNQIIVKNVNKDKEKLYEKDGTYNIGIQPNSQRVNLTEAINLIIDFDETI